MARRGRRPVLDREKQETICAVLRLGGSRRLAAQYVGCAVNTIRHTEERDEDFAADVERAETQQAVLHLKNLESAAREAKYWRASAWFLERRCADRYGPQTRGTAWRARLSRALGELAEILVEEVPVEAYRKRILARLATLTAAMEEEAEGETRSDQREGGAGDSEEPDV